MVLMLKLDNVLLQIEGGGEALSNEEKKTRCHTPAEFLDPDGDDFRFTTDEAELRRASANETCSFVLENEESSRVFLWRSLTFRCRTLLQSLSSRFYTHSFITTINRSKGSHGLRATHSNTDQC